MPKNNANSSPDANSDEFNRWGSSKESRASGRGDRWPIYAAAGQCDYESDGNAWIAFDRVGDFVFDEEHLYVGSEPMRCDHGANRPVPGNPIVWDL